MAYGWSTTKTILGDYEWSVYRVEYNKPVEVLDCGLSNTRAKARARAKKVVMLYRRPSATQLRIAA